MPRLSLLGVVVLAAVLPGVAHEDQEIGKGDFFRLVIDAPARLALPDLPGRAGAPGEAFLRQAGQLPRLIVPDGSAEVYWRLPADRHAWRGGRSLVFVGRLTGERLPRALVLRYPTAAVKKEGLAGLTGDHPQATLAIEPDWQATLREQPSQKALRRQWEAARVGALLLLRQRAPGLPFFDLAERALKARDLAPHWWPRAGQDGKERRSAGLYALTTGGTALSESLALDRLRAGGEKDRGPRLHPVDKIEGITIAEHPWEKMMAGKKPRPEPLARWVPADNYYVALRDVAAYVEAADTLQRWGGNVLQPFVLHDRDRDLRRRYEEQLCLPAAELAKDPAGKQVRGLALTGNDPFLAEGSDLTVLLDLRDPAAFLKWHDGIIRRATAAHKDVAEHQWKYRGVAVRAWRTPGREVSLYRAVVGEVVVCSNSPAALRRVLDVRHGKAKALADALDFQYMRTVFARGDKGEDGFVFLSGAFIRNLAGPASRIREKRRREAQAALTLASHAALLGRWREGRWPATGQALLEAGQLPREALDVPDGKPVRWDAKRRATSEVYGTLAFLTPLVELSIDKVTQGERDDYEVFRREYMRLWRRFFDPVGIRFRLTREEVKVETYILPLVNNSRYNGLRAVAGGLARHDPGLLPAGTLCRVLTGLGDGRYTSLFLAGDNPVYQAFVDWQVRRELEPARDRSEEHGKLFWRLPIALVVHAPKADLEDAQKFLQELWRKNLRGKAGDLTEQTYRGTTIRKAPIDPHRYRVVAEIVRILAGTQDDADLLLQFLRALPEKEAPAAVYAASAAGHYLLSFSETAVRRHIDTLLAWQKGKKTGEEVNTALDLGPDTQAARALRGYLEQCPDQELDQ